MTGRLLPPPALVKQGEAYFLVPLHQVEIRKLAAMAGDLRAVTFQNQKRVQTNAPTEGSKLEAYKQLKRTQETGKLAKFPKPKPFWKPGAIAQTTLKAI